MASPSAPPAGVPHATLWPALALTLNAFTWGVSWWPIRQLQGLGLHPLWATALIYTVAVAAITLWRPGAWLQMARTRTLWLLVLAAGTMELIRRWHKRNAVQHREEVERLLAIARSDHP